MEFSGDIGLWQRRVAECPEGATRRLAVFEALMPQAGMRVLDVGCGSGHLVQELARAVGPSGRVVGVDISDDQLNAARERCADVPFVELLYADVCDLPLEDGRLDGVSRASTRAWNSSNFCIASSFVSAIAGVAISPPSAMTAQSRSGLSMASSLVFLALALCAPR